MSGAPRIVIAGGGSGGHVFPGLAIAEAMARGARVEVIFVGTKRGIETKLIPARGYELEILDVRPIKGQGRLQAARSIFFATKAVARALAFVRRVSPRAVVSVGGYAAGPIAVAAWVLRVPLAIVEPNAVVGLTNRMLAPFASRAYIAFDSAAPRFAPQGTRRFGVPLRQGFAGNAYTPADPLRILVLGGSQGAAVLNDRLPEAIGRVVRRHPEVQVLHQAGEGRDAVVNEAYAQFRVPGARAVAFVDDVALELVRADVVVARSGAGTVAEIAAVGRPALLIPFPYAADDHQAANARALEGAGGAVCVRQEIADASRLARELLSLLDDRERRITMSQASRDFGRPEAAVEVARDLCDLAGIPWSLPANAPSPVDRSSGWPLGV